MAEAHSPRVALVTGGSKGLGAGLVEAYLDGRLLRRDLLALVDRPGAAWENDPEFKERFHFATADVSKTDEAERFVKDAAKRWGRIDVLVNNAGVARDGVIALFGDDDLDTVVDLNLKGTVYVTRAASRVMLRQHSGSIVNISSIVGLSGYRGLTVYGATKAALDGFTRAPGPRARLTGHHGEQRRPGLPPHRDEPRPRRGPARADRAAHADGPPGRPGRRRPRRPLPDRPGQQLPDRPGHRRRRRAHLLTAESCRR